MMHIGVAQSLDLEATDPLAAPAWAARWFADVPTRRNAGERELSISVAEVAGFSLVSTRSCGAATVSPEAFERISNDAYAAIARELAPLPARHPVRFWNHIPDIHRASGDRLDRYMVFNAGRYNACKNWLGGEAAFPTLLATASGVGHSSDDLVIHALAASRQGRAVENPRQIPAYCYSKRFGPRPPCFARATVIDGRAEIPHTLILVGGTASVRGEESVHVGDLASQTRETFENLAALAEAAGANAPGLASFCDVRVYYVRDADLSALRDSCGLAFAGAHLEYMRADLCRADLLVEIEGVANGTSSGRGVK